MVMMGKQMSVKMLLLKQLIFGHGGEMLHLKLLESALQSGLQAVAYAM
jgi:hypothetical protein